MCRTLFFFFQAEDGIRDVAVTGVQTCALPISQRYQGVSSLCSSIRGCGAQCNVAPGWAQNWAQETSSGFAAEAPKAANSIKDRKSTRLNSSHGYISYAVFCLKKKIIRESHLYY